MVRNLGGFVTTVGDAVGSTAPTNAPDVGDAPTVVAPDQAYTNDDSVDVTVNVPAPVVGSAAYSVRLYVTLKDAAPKVVAEQAVGPTSQLVIPGVDLSPGRNDFQASIVGPGGESELSPVATWVMDNSKPKLMIISPDDGASTNKDAVTVKGKTQAGSTVRLRNDDQRRDRDGRRRQERAVLARIAVAAGTNEILVTSTDPAGNPNEASISVRKGSGKLTADLTATLYRFKVTGSRGAYVHGGRHRTRRACGPGRRRRCSPSASPASRPSCPTRSRRAATARRRSRPGSRAAPCRARAGDGPRHDRQVRHDQRPPGAHRPLSGGSDRAFDAVPKALDTAAVRGYDPPMPVWRCPHCGTPQAETSRCWVCHRSTTSCATCRHFRRGVANGLGLCGLDPRRGALRGDEIRDCWTAASTAAVDGLPPSTPMAAAPDPGRRPARTFVPVDELGALDAGSRSAAIAGPAPGSADAGRARRGTPGRVAAAGGGWSLWGDLEG